MQDPSAFQQQQQQLQFPEQEQHLKCPRCDSTNTKFCYYNNYNLSQPRHYCKNCRRYWTKGGALRNIPVGGGSRKNTKRQKRASPSSSASNSKPEMAGIFTPATSPAEQDHRMLDMSGSFSSLLTSNGQFGSFADLGNHNSDGLLGNHNTDGLLRNHNSDGLLGNHNSDGVLGNSSSWVDGNGNGWPDLSIYTPGSRFHQ